MFRQIIILLGIVVVILGFGLVILYLKPSAIVTVHFKEGIARADLTGEITEKEKYIIVKPVDGGQDQIIPWEQIANITGNEPAYNKRLNDVTDLLELIAKLGVLAAAGIFLIGLYQFDVGQRWKSEEFLADMIRDFGKSPNVENAKKMIELLMFYPQGRKIGLYPEKEVSDYQFVTVEQVGRALATAKTDELTDDEMRIRESFDAFFNRLERFEHYIESRLVTSRSVYIYLGYWINTLLGRETIKGQVPKLSQEHRQWLLDYLEMYEFPQAIRLLKRYRQQWPWSRYVRSLEGGTNKGKPPNATLTAASK